VSSETDPISLPAFESPKRLVECLQKSPTSLVKLAPGLGETEIKIWADACQKAGKSLFLSLPSTPNLPQKRQLLGWRLKRVFDWLGAVLLLLLLSPLLLLIALLVKRSSEGPIFFQQWRVGERGKLFKIFKFRTMVVDAENQHHQVMQKQTGLHKLKDDPRVTKLGRLLRKYSLDELPQLINVVRGEMSLVGPRPWALYDAVRIEPELRHRLNALPGITGAWQVEARSHEVDISLVNRRDLMYLKNWTVWQDMKFLLLTVPKVISGFGAY
jgi:lipopolysaccharide/colanic/teichoic acid biosynthesis glycosyltransferase